MTYFNFDSNMESNYSVPAKRRKFEVKSPTVSKRIDVAKKESVKCDDIWGDDFAEEDIREFDLIASQACLQDNHVLSQSNVRQDGLSSSRYHTASTSKASSIVNTNEKLQSKSLASTSQFNTINRTATNLNVTANTSSDIGYTQFKYKLMNQKTHNSTFQAQNDVIVSENDYSKELERLKLENQKLLNDFITKDGEVVFLRNQLQQTQQRSQNEKMEKTRFIEEQANRHRSEMNAICKEKEYLKTQLDLQKFEVGSLTERCKLLESGSVKLTEPQRVNLNMSANIDRHNSSISRLSSSIKSLKVKEACVQTGTRNRSYSFLKTSNSYYPLTKIPKLIYDTPQPEKPVIDIHIIEKTGKRNLPILQEEDSFKIFENPDLVKPLTTMVDGRKLTAEFILPEVAVLQTKTDFELESEHSIPLINKLVSTARELILNAIVVLQTIFQAMTNDDIRDMNDIYFSDLYSNSRLYAKSLCSASPWHKEERGVEARGILGVLSYVTLESSYLSKYIAGKIPLLTERDEYYKKYRLQMIRYDTWSEKGHRFEMLEMILKFVTLVGSVRRSHQFSGLLCAIATLVHSVHVKIGYCDRGMEYVSQIFKEIVFSRPLPYCYVSLSNIMVIFAKSLTYLPKLCVSSQSMAVKNWKGALHFTPDACPLQIFLAEMENHESDIVTRVDIASALLLFAQYVLQTNIVPLRTEGSESCNCCMKLLRFTIKTLWKCSEVDLSTLEVESDCSVPASGQLCKLSKICSKHCAHNHALHEKCIMEVYQEKFTDVNFWMLTKRKQSRVLKNGIKFLCHLAICDPDFVIRQSEIEDSFHLFMRNIGSFDNLILHDNEREAINRIRQTFIFEKISQPETPHCHRNTTTNQLDILQNFEKRIIQPSSSNLKPNKDYKKTLSALKRLYDNTKMKYSVY